MSFSAIWQPRRYAFVKIDSPTPNEALVNPGPVVLYTAEDTVIARRVRLYNGPIPKSATLLYDSGWRPGDQSRIDVPWGIVQQYGATHYVNVAVQLVDGRFGLSDTRAFTVNWIAPVVSPEVVLSKIDMCNAPQALPRIRVSWHQYHPYNLVTDGWFDDEDAIDAWTVYNSTLSYITENPYESPGAMLVSRVASSDFGAIYEIPLSGVTTGRVFNASVRARRNSGDASQPFVVRLREVGGAFASQETVTSAISLTGTSWTEVINSRTIARADRTGLQIIPHLTGSGSGTSFALDGVNVYETPQETVVYYLVLRRARSEPWRILARVGPETLRYFDYSAIPWTPYQYAIQAIVQQGSQTYISEIRTDGEEIVLEFDGLWIHRRDDPTVSLRFDSWSVQHALDKPIEFQQPWGRKARVALVSETLVDEWVLPGSPSVYDRKDWTKIRDMIESQYTDGAVYVARFGRQRHSANVIMHGAKRAEARNSAVPTITITEVSVEDQNEQALANVSA